MKNKPHSLRPISHLLGVLALLSLLAQLSSAQMAPTISRQPASQTNLAGTTATLSVAVSGTGPFIYRWAFNGTTLPNIITTVAGGGRPSFPSSGDGGTATNASLAYPSGVAVDPSGNLYIADLQSSRIRKVDANGIITTVAGGGTNNPGDGGAATNASLAYPSGEAVDPSGNLYIADKGNHRIRKVDPVGIITTVAGNGYINPSTRSGRYSGDGGAAASASLNSPTGMALDASGNLFIADSRNNVIRKVDTNGVIITVAGNGAYGYTGDGSAATNASVNFPTGVAVDSSGNLFVADSLNNRVRKVDFAGPDNLLLSNLSDANVGSYQVIVTSPYGSVTSAVARLTMVLPPVMNPPLISGNNLLLGFSLSNSSTSSFTLLQTPNLTAPWTTNTAAVLTTNAQTGGFQFSIPAPNSVEFYRVRSP